MWCIYLLFAILLIIYAFVVVLAYGIKTTIRIDANNLSASINVFIFDWIEIIGFKIFVCEQRFYFQFNKGDIKLIERSDKKQDEKKKNKKKDKKLNAISFIYYVLEHMPKIKLINPTVEYGVQFEEIKNKAMFDGGVAFMINGALQMLQEKIEVSNLKIENVGDSTAFRGLYLEGVIKLSLVKIFFYILHILGQKRRFQKA